MDYRQITETLRTYFEKTSFEGKRFEESRVEAIINEDVIASLQSDRMNAKWSSDVLQELKCFFSDCRVEGRIKSLYSVLYKLIDADAIVGALLKADLTSEEFTKELFTANLKENPMDTIGYKLVCKSESDCYQIASKISSIYSVLYFNDRIIRPKSSGYKDIRMVVIMEAPSTNVEKPVSLPVEIIIQSEKMYDDSKQGGQLHSLAYPWKYAKELLELPDQFQAMIVQ